MVDKKYCMIVTAEDERYQNGKKLDFFANHPEEGLLQDIVFGDSDEELYAAGDNEGLFYQLYDCSSGCKIGSGTLDPDCLKEDLNEWGKFVSYCQINGEIEKNLTNFQIFGHSEVSYE